MKTLFDDYFAEQDDRVAREQKRRALEHQKDLWRIVWNWDGPVVGETLQFHNVFETDTDGVCRYVYMLTATAIEHDLIDDKWLVECRPFTNPDTSQPHDLSGKLFWLDANGIWPDYKRLRNHETHPSQP